jgi:hypothetical protein
MHGDCRESRLNKIALSSSIGAARVEPQNATTSPQEDHMLFTDRSLWTMLHGVVLGGAALMALAAALYAVTTMPTPGNRMTNGEPSCRSLAWLTGFIAAVLWLAVIVGTYIVFPLYRAAPPEGLADLGSYPRSLLLANPDTRWLHAFGMESKEHMPWIASMLATAVAFVAARYRAALLSDGGVRRTATAFLAVCFVLVSFVGLMGVFIDKVAPLE